MLGRGPDRRPQRPGDARRCRSAPTPVGSIRPRCDPSSCRWSWRRPAGSAPSGAAADPRVAAAIRAIDRPSRPAAAAPASGASPARRTSVVPTVIAVSWAMTSWTSRVAGQDAAQVGDAGVGQGDDPVLAFLERPEDADLGRVADASEERIRGPLGRSASAWVRPIETGTSAATPERGRVAADLGRLGADLVGRRLEVGVVARPAGRCRRRPRAGRQVAGRRRTADEPERRGLDGRASAGRPIVARSATGVGSARAIAGQRARATPGEPTAERRRRATPDRAPASARVQLGAGREPVDRRPSPSRSAGHTTSIPARSHNRGQARCARSSASRTTPSRARRPRGGRVGSKRVIGSGDPGSGRSNAAGRHSSGTVPVPIDDRAIDGRREAARGRRSSTPLLRLVRQLREAGVPVSSSEVIDATERARAHRPRRPAGGPRCAGDDPRQARPRTGPRSTCCSSCTSRSGAGAAAGRRGRRRRPGRAARSRRASTG